MKFSQGLAGISESRNEISVVLKWRVENALADGIANEIQHIFERVQYRAISTSQFAKTKKKRENPQIQRLADLKRQFAFECVYGTRKCANFQSNLAKSLIAKGRSGQETESLSLIL